MIQARASVLIARPTDQVFAFVATNFFSNYQRWSREVVSVRKLSDGPVQVGTRGRQVRVDHGRRTDATFRVAALEPGERIEFEGLTMPFAISYHVEEIAGDTRLTFEFELHRLALYMRPFEKLIRRTVQDDAARVVRNIKQLVEAEIPQGSVH
jgi:hypothetical protein